MKTLHKNFVTAVLLAGVVTLLGSAPAAADQKFLDDVIICGSLCVGLDCVNGENFGFDTIRIKENNTRVQFDDTSTSASFPRNDWRLTANDSSNGGQDRFSIEDATNGKVPFTVEGNAASNSLYVDSTSRIGFKTNAPVVELHVKDGDTPTLRLEQDGSSGFTPQTWDLAGNETSFFVRDATNGSKLPFRIRPNAPSSSLDVSANGDIGVGTASPEEPLHVRRTDGRAKLFIEETLAGTHDLMTLENNGRVEFRFTDTSAGGNDWTFANTQASGGAIFITASGTGANELVLEKDGDLTITGMLTTAFAEMPDYVFEADYELMPLADLDAFIKENKHLPNIPSAAEVASAGQKINLTEMQRVLLEKVEELTLYTVDQHRVIAELEARLEALEKDSEQ